MKNCDYRPFKGGFPYKLLRYLYDNGESAGVDAQAGIGLNTWASSKGMVYYYRASNNFDAIVRGLNQRGLIEILPNDRYKLSKDGTEFVDNYKVR